jgi:cytoskeletal protein CcmA (bactofilin family)
MLNLGRRDAPNEAKDAGKPALGPAPYGNAGISASHGAGTAARSTAPPPAAPAREAAPAAPAAEELAGSKLTVGPNIKLKGVEIADCDILVVEGHVEATVNSKVMQIAQPGTLKGTATIDVAEIHGEFSGELTARKRLIIHGTGRVSGTIRYGKLIVAEGGELTGDVKRLDVATDAPQRAPALAPDLGLPRTPQPLR